MNSATTFALPRYGARQYHEKASVERQHDRAVSPLPPKEKVCIFIDNSNLFHGLRGLASEWGEQKKLDYIRLRDFLADGRESEVRFYYSLPDNDSVSDDESAQRRTNFYTFLEENLNFYMVPLPLRERSGYNPIILALIGSLRQRGATDEELLQITGQRSYWLRQITGELVSEEKGLDCEVVFDMVRLAHFQRFHTYILVAADEDYARTVRKLRGECGLRIEVAWFGSHRCSKVLRREASGFVDLMRVPGLFK
jgi:uncharacterized LabA/DUF88 family protein